VKALIVRLSSIGDVVHTLPVLAALRRQGWETDWLAEPGGSALLERNPLLTHLITVPRAASLNVGHVRRTLASLRQRAYDVALDFQGLWKSAFWTRFSGAQRLIGYAPAWRREPSSSWLIPEQLDLPPSAVHVIDKNLALLRALAIDALGGREFPLPPAEAEAVQVRTRLAEIGLTDFIVLNPGGGWPSKLWPAERFGTVARALRERGLATLVTWGPGEEKLADRVVAASDGAALRAFPTTLLELAELARRARLVVACDTGPLQIACAVSAPVVGIFGPTDPARNGPFSQKDIIVRRTPLCAPCHKRRCFIHSGVMDAIQVDEVMRAIDRRLGLSGRHANL
jgi:heptosyltransferase I